MNYKLLLLLMIFSNVLLAQVKDADSIPEVMIESQRIAVPFSKSSHTIDVIDKETIQNSPANNIADVLQHVPGIDVKRRGIDGMQSDIYIRGGSFEHVLILVDGIKTDDVQTGHHTMNITIPMSNIERIEVVKGPAARIYGQKAFSGAINIVTKKDVENSISIKAGLGSFGRINAELSGAVNIKNTNHQFHYSKNISTGYRHNTDYNNDNYFLKSTFKTKKAPIDILLAFSERKFGANGFYGAPLVPVYKDQYEETQTSLVGVSTQFRVKDFTFKPRVYWRRNQDNYFFLRDNPSFFENFHISNKIGLELNGNYSSKLGITGAGIEFSQVYLFSNNLGNRQRTAANLFLEHRFELFKGKLDITPGIAVNYFSDFKFHAFPGLDISYKISKNFNLYGNIGYTYRIPTYTELYYTSPTTLGNTELKAENAISEELGIRFTNKNFNINLIGFNKDANNLIDYTKAVETDRYQANNIRKVGTTGLEANLQYKVKFLDLPQFFKAGYTFMVEDVKGLDVPFSRYSLNSAKHQFNLSADFSFLKQVKHNLSYRYVERVEKLHYNIWDAKLTFEIKSFELSGVINNIFDIEYSETNLVPMPGRNFMFDLKYTFK